MKEYELYNYEIKVSKKPPSMTLNLKDPSNQFIYLIGYAKRFSDKLEKIETGIVSEINLKEGYVITRNSKYKLMPKEIKINK